MIRCYFLYRFTSKLNINQTSLLIAQFAIFYGIILCLQEWPKKLLQLILIILQWLTLRNFNSGLVLLSELMPLYGYKMSFRNTYLSKKWSFKLAEKPIYLQWKLG